MMTLQNRAFQPRATRGRRIRTILALLLVAALASSCSGASSPSAEGSTTSSSNETTLTTAVPSTVGPVTSPTTDQPVTSEPPIDSGTNQRASGSGCTPAGDELEEGRWFGYVSVASANELSFDLACWFTGSAAVDAASEDGAESPPPNDYYIRNINDRLRTISVDDGAAVTWLPIGDPASAVTASYEEWVDNRPLRSFLPGVWISTVSGAISAIEEQYQP